ncbi:hypothetical protein F5888DRAFT_1409101 [Russula emetica]|nr:hypothetical protein F5888DRAFT_1409101 [Russula emetica]
MLSLSKGVTHMPDRLAYKQTYPIKGRSQEGPLFSQLIGQFGIADVIGYYICGTEEPHGSTGPFLVDAKVWDVFKDQIDEEANEQDLVEDGLTPQHHKPEERGLQCIALSTEGQALLDHRNENGGTPSPGELLETILHAIIGHYNLFDKGILHRDISSGNILRYSKPVWRPALDKFGCTRNVNYCRGFLIDGDHVI